MAKTEVKSRRLNRLAARALLRAILASATGMPPTAIPIVRSHSGKPLLAGEGPHFNVSHSGAWIAIAVSTVGAVGVDIEAARTAFPETLRHGLSRRMTPRGRRASMSSDDGAMFGVWTRMEAILKLSGDGMSGMDDLLAEPLAADMFFAPQLFAGTPYGNAVLWDFAMEDAFPMRLTLALTTGSPAPEILFLDAMTS